MASSSKPAARKASPFGTSNRTAAFTPPRADFNSAAPTRPSVARRATATGTADLDGAATLASYPAAPRQIGKKPTAKKSPPKKAPPKKVAKAPARSGSGYPAAPGGTKPKTPPKPAPKTPTKFYPPSNVFPKAVVVKKGDNLWNTVKKSLSPGASNELIQAGVNALVRVNKIKNPNLIRPGQTLRFY